ncbi:hypothetical protein AU467_06085 [Mesorhizobium loti]|uniref:Integrase DNA-binding domain-containing protein n=1 Tax=Rhizobium loti TaxID=381 RepID=A0A117N2G0_RHILI|nr:hypothetical protein AU467_06085 [Mesorhizobium loti]
MYPQATELLGILGFFIWRRLLQSARITASNYERMARVLNKLSDTAIRVKELPAGRYGDGGGLYLYVSPTGNKSWVFFHAQPPQREAAAGTIDAETIEEQRAIYMRTQLVLSRPAAQVTGDEESYLAGFGSCDEREADDEREQPDHF